MKTIGTITFHRTINHGAILQAYALQRVLKEMGHISEIIDYCNPQRRLATLSFSHRVRYFAWNKVMKKVLVGNKRQKKTEEFVRKYIPLSAQSYSNTESLFSDPPLYDAYITGSDQVWNPGINHNDPTFFLAFAPPGRKRIAYAASFGVSKIQDKYVGNYGEWLRQIHTISSRELEGKLLVEQLSGRKAEIVLDPTLLLDKEQWNRIAVPYKSSKPYILCYYMPGDKDSDQSLTKLAYKVSSMTGWGCTCIGLKEYMVLNPRRCSIFDAGPAEFLGLFQNASFVVTNSFHGTAFSVNYRKPFLVPINHNLSQEKALSSRITHLLKSLYLESRLIPTGTGLPSENILNLDYKPVEARLQQQKNTSMDFLRNALGEG